MTKITVKLQRPARKAGGDRYEADNGFQIYIPQNISRPESDTPIKAFEITFTPVK